MAQHLCIKIKQEYTLIKMNSLQVLTATKNHRIPTENKYHLECILITVTKQIVAITSSVKSSYIS